MFSQASLGGRLFPALVPVRRKSLCFAVLPDDEARERIWRLAHRVRDDHGLKGQPLRINRSHVTLLGLGSFAEVPEIVVEAARHTAESVDLPAFDVAFDRVESFRARERPPTVLAGSEETTAGLFRLAEQLRAPLGRLGLPVDRLTRPHVTLLHGDRRIVEHGVEPIRWTVGELVLIKSFTGESQYIELGRWPLRAPVCS